MKINVINEISLIELVTDKIKNFMEFQKQKYHEANPGLENKVTIQFTQEEERDLALLKQGNKTEKDLDPSLIIKRDAFIKEIEALEERRTAGEIRIDFMDTDEIIKYFVLTEEEVISISFQE